MEEFLHQYGYIALSIGTFFEGETAIMVASSLVHSGFFFGPYTLFFGFFGSFLSDWLYFLIGRFNGKYFLARHEGLRKKFEPAHNFFNSHRLQVLFSYRFLYGFRILLPLLIGMSDITMWHFLGYSILAGLIWASTVTTVGFLAGLIFNLTPQSFEQNIVYVIIGFATVGLAIGYGVKRFTEKEIGL